ncbi:MAG: hypothetical protein RLZZ01_2649 [Actinomycetota bacterium]
MGRDRERDEAFAVLGLPVTASEDEVRAARRRLAKAAHPDVGGSEDRMRLVNEAADTALAAIATRSAGRRPVEPPPNPIRRDHPSFVVEALPAETFEALRIVAANLGRIVDDDPPYCLEMIFDEMVFDEMVFDVPPETWCRLDLVPDAGSSTVSVSTAGSANIAVEWVRDVLIDELNRLDWSMLQV